MEPECHSHSVYGNRGWRFMAAYAQRKLLKQRGAAVGSSTDGNRRIFNSTDAPDIEQHIIQGPSRTDATRKEKSSCCANSAQNKSIFSSQQLITTMGGLCHNCSINNSAQLTMTSFTGTVWIKDFTQGHLRGGKQRLMMFPVCATLGQTGDLPATTLFSEAQCSHEGEKSWYYCSVEHHMQTFTNQGWTQSNSTMDCVLFLSNYERLWNMRYEIWCLQYMRK